MMKKKRWYSWFRREKRNAARLLKNPFAVIRAADRASQKAPSARGPLTHLWDDLQTAIRLARAWGRREYRGVTRGTIVLVVGALLYLVSPIDAIPDVIPVLGFVDDAAVLGWVLRRVRSELVAFRAWESTRLSVPGAEGGPGHIDALADSASAG